ncbi:ribosomal protein S18-alanine N-acetyltransferase [Chloroflexota bacterium]
MDIKRYPYYIRPIYREDVSQVNELDREVFPTQWPPPNYQRELQNKLARLLVACDNNKAIEAPEIEAPHGKGILARVKNLFTSGPLPNTLPPSNWHYVVGFAGIWILADEVHITNIAVRNLYQRQGIGELLLIATIDLAAELKASLLTLEVRASNLPAQKLYGKYGFVQVGLRRGYYTDNREDAVLMSTESIDSASFQAQFRQLRQAYCQRYGIATESLARSLSG